MCQSYLLSLLLYSFVGVSIQEDLWYSYQFGSGHGNRRELFISKVDAVDYFKTKENVLQWRSVSLKDRSIAMGLTADGVTILQVDKSGKSFATNETHTPMNATVFDAAIFKYWMRDAARSEIIAVVAVDAQNSDNSVDLLWFRLNANNKLVKFWKWPLLKKIIHLNVFHLVDDEDKYNILISNDRYENYTTTDWYQFHLGQHNDFWLKQAIRLDSPTNSTAISTHGANTYLSIPQNDQLRIFSLEDQNTHFINCYNFSAGKVSFVISFKVAFQSYIAIDGHAAGIYKFSSQPQDKYGFLSKQIVENANLHGIDYWLAIPISTYKDEEILIAERNLDFSTHKSYAIQVIIHHGGRFVLHEEMTCDYYGDTSNGLNCLVEEDTNAQGIKGSTFITVNDTLGVLVPRHQKASGLFVVTTEVKELRSPLEERMNAFEEHKRKIEEKLHRLQEKFGPKHVQNKTAGFPEKQISSEPMLQLGDLKNSAEAANSEKIVSQSAPMFALNMDEITRRVSALQESINIMMSDLPKLPFLQYDRIEYDTLILNSLVEVQGLSNVQSVFTDTFNGVTTDQVPADIYHIHQEQPLSGHKMFANLRVDELECNIVNGIPSENLKYRSEPLVFQGNVILKGELIVNGNVESEQVFDVNLEEDIVYIPSQKNYNGNLNFESLNVRETLNVNKVNKFPIHHTHQEAQIEENPSAETIFFRNIFLPGNLTVQNINGENFNEILKVLCLKNMDTFIPDTTIIEGNIDVENKAFTLFLNGLKYPQEYILSKANTFSHITGIKNFTTNVVVGELTSSGTVNGINLTDVITLSRSQKIEGTVSFASLDVTNNLQLDGEIIGKLHEHQILTKPTLIDSNQIISDVNFKNLEVTGKITIASDFNGTNLQDLLADVVYKNEDSVDINSVKQFPYGLTVLQDLALASARINNIDVNKLVHKETEGVLYINQLRGDVTFENILLTGHFNGVDVVKLDQEAVKLSGEQFISSQIVFDEELEANEIDIKNDLNEIPLEQYLYSNAKISIDTLNTEKLRVGNLIIMNSLIASEEDFNLKEFDEHRFSLTREQIVTEGFIINGSRVPNLATTYINGYNFHDIFDLDAYTRKIMDLLMSGKLSIKELIVDDSLLIGDLNDKPMKDVLKLCLSTKKGERELVINFQDVRFGNLHVKKFNDIDFSSFRQNLVFKDEHEVEIFGHKVYFNGFEVNNFIQTSALNNISIYDILRKNERQEIASALVLLGNVVLEGDCRLDETFNLVPIDNITNTFHAVDEHRYQVRGDVVLTKGPVIENLQVQSINGVDMKGFFDNLVYLNGETARKLGNITFARNVAIKGNLNTQEINGIELSSLKDEIVIITQDGALQSPVTFTSDLVVQEDIQIDTDLYTGDLQGVNPADWIKRAVFVNQGKISHRLNFQSVVIESDVKTGYLNNINMSTLIPLKSDLKIDDKLTFYELSPINDIKVGNLVNSKKLSTEYLNTVMSGQLQYIKGNVVFKGNVLVREWLDIYNLVNGHDLGKIVTTDADQNLLATYRFMERTIANNNVVVWGLVNSVNITKWMQNGIKKNLRETQVISNSWVTSSSFIFENDVTGAGLLNGVNIHKMAEAAEYRRAFKYSVEKDLVDNYQKICSDINTVITTTKKQIYSFKYLEYKQFIELPEKIEYVHDFEHQGKNYLLIKDKGCSSKLFMWMEEFFSPIEEYETGMFIQVVTVRDGDDLYLITRDSERNTSKHLASGDCNIAGTNVWKFGDEKLLLTQKLNDRILLQESKIPGTFYAMEKDAVLEYRILASDGIFYPVQKWSVPTENAAFLEHGLKTGLSIRNGHQLYRLQRQEVPIGLPSDEMVVGNFTTVQNTYIPGRNGEMLLLNVGYLRWKNMVAVATHEATSVMGKLDFIKVYEDPMSGKVFHKVPTFRPSSLVSLEFGENGETLLVFLENSELLQIYEYRGVEGFKFRAKANVEGNKLIRINLPRRIGGKPRSFIGLINKNHFALLEAIMDGDQLDLNQLTCSLS